MLARWRGTVYNAGVAVVALGVAAVTPGVVPPREPTYVLMVAALCVGALLTVRLRPGDERVTSLIVVPTVVAYVRFGGAALPGMAVASLLAPLARGVRPVAALAGVGHDVLALGVALLATRSVGLPPVWEAVGFTLAFIGLREALWRGAEQWSLPPTDDPRAERPDALLSLLLAPLAALPLVVGSRLEDGALLLSLAALFLVLLVMREAANLGTARSEANAERDRLQRANQLQEELMYLITHELKNPLTMVRAYTQLGQQAIERQQMDRLAGYLTNVDRGGVAMERLVENLLQLSRLEQSGELPPAEPVAVGEMAEDVVATLGLLAEQKQQILLVDVAEDLPSALAPPQLLREALSNLVSNAVKYTPEGGKVSVWAREGGEQGTLVVGVTDSGIGLSEEDREHLFTRFFRSANPRARQERGTGLGLALTHAIILRMGGRIDVESTLDVGTTFRMVLPAADAQT